MYWPYYWQHVNLQTIIAPRYERSYYRTSIVTNTLVWIVSDVFYIATPRYATGRWFSLGPPISSTNKTDHHDITALLLKMSLNTIKQRHGRWCGSLQMYSVLQHLVTNGCWYDSLWIYCPMWRWDSSSSNPLIFVEDRDENLSTIGWEKVFVPLWLGYWYLFAHWFQILCIHWFVCKCCFFQMKSLPACVKVQNGYQLWSISSLSPKIQSHSNSPILGGLSMF